MNTIMEDHNPAHALGSPATDFHARRAVLRAAGAVSLAGLAAAGLSGCVSSSSAARARAAGPAPIYPPNYR
ncbi:MAG: hypothetical protein AAGH92_12290, partial [Planctomycetota bacterium]